MKGCDCKNWEYGISDIDLYIINSGSDGGYEKSDLNFSYCPWCGKKLRNYGTLTPQENREAFRDLTNALHDKLSRNASSGVRRVYIDPTNDLQMWIELEHQVFKEPVERYMVDKIEPISEHIDGKYKFTYYDSVKKETIKWDDIDILPDTGQWGEDELDKLFKELGDI